MVSEVSPALISLHGYLVELLMLLGAVILQGAEHPRGLLSRLDFGRGLEVAGIDPIKVLRQGCLPWRLTLPTGCQHSLPLPPTLSQFRYFSPALLHRP